MRQRRDEGTGELIGMAGALMVLVGVLIGTTNFGCVLNDDLLANATSNLVSEAGATVATTNTTATTTTTQPAAESAYKITRVVANEIRWTGPCPNWVSPKNDGCIGEVHLYHVAGANGRHEGKFDHFRKYSGTAIRDFKNVWGGYRIARGWVAPAGGERMRLEMVSYDGREHIVVGEFDWVAKRGWFARLFSGGGK